MKNETLELIKRDAEYKKKETESFNAIVDRIHELEEDPKVQEYSSLLKSIVGIPRHISLTEKDFCELAFRQHAGDILPDDSNDVYVFMGIFGFDKNSNFYYKVSGNTDGKLYKKYQDIELGNVVLIELDKADEFERENFVIFGDNDDEVNLYRDVQGDFIQEAINKDQDAALRLIHKKYSQND